MTFKKFNATMMEIGFPDFYPIDCAWIKKEGGCVAWLTTEFKSRGKRVKHGKFMYIETNNGVYIGPKPKTAEQLKTLFEIMDVFK